MVSLPHHPTPPWGKQGFEITHPSLPGSPRQGHLPPISGLAKWGDLQSTLTRGRGWESFPERAQWLLILMACLAPRSQLPRRLLMEKRAWPERLWLLVPAGPHPLLTPGGDGTALQQTLRTHAAEGDPRACHHLHGPRSCPLQVPRTQTQICRFQRKSGSIMTPSPNGLISVTACCCLHCHCAWVLCRALYKCCLRQRSAVSVSAMTAVTLYCFWCWSFLHLGHVFLGGPRAGRSAVLSWLCHGLLQRCQGSRRGHGQRAAEVEGFRISQSPVKIQAGILQRGVPGAGFPNTPAPVCHTLPACLCPDTVRYQAAEWPRRAAGSCLLKETTSVVSSPLPAQWNLSTSGVGDSSTFKTDHVPTGAGQGSSGQNAPPATCSC